MYSGTRAVGPPRTDKPTLRRAMERRSGNLRYTGLKSHPKTASDCSHAGEARSSALGAAGAGSCAARGGVQVSSARRVGQCCQPLGPFKIPRVPPTLVVLGRNSHIVHSHLGACDARLRACGLATELICQCPVGAGRNENEFNGGASRANSRCASTPRPAAVFRRWHERSSGTHRSFP